MFKLPWKEAKNPLPVYMHPIEFSQVVAAIKATQPRRVLEWGSGGSTREISERFPFIERYISIEHERDWYEKVRSLVTDPRLDLYFVEPDNPHLAKPSRRVLKRWEHKAEVDPTILKTYVEYPRTLDLRFDLVLVDGRARVQCMKVGFDLLDSGGLIIIHDAERDVYADTIATLGRAVYLVPWHQGQICMIRKP